MDDSLFVYGTLQFPEVLTELIGRTPLLERAEAPGWRVAALPGRVYPGMVRAEGGPARGVVLTGLSAAEWAVLDAFEDDEYELLPVQLAGRVELCRAYVWTAETAAEDWSAEAFAAAHLADFTQRCKQWRRMIGEHSGS